MPTGNAHGVSFTPEMYWLIREREIGRKLQLVKDSIDECEAARRVLLNLSGTAKIHDPEWEQAQARAMASLRRARTNKMALRRMVANARDTIRIRPAYAEVLSEKTAAILDTASRLCEYLDAHGF